MFLLCMLLSCTAEKFDGGYASMEALGQAFVTALNTGQPATIEKELLPQEGYTQFVYPRLPVSKPDWNTPAEVAWELQRMHMDKRARQISRWADRGPWKLARVETGARRETYGDLVFLRDVALVLQDGSGQEEVFDRVGTVVQKDGRYQILSLRGQ